MNIDIECWMMIIINDAADDDVMLMLLGCWFFHDMN